MLFTILFGLSMDYEVFLLSRIREEWLRTGDNATVGGRRPGPDRPGHHRGRRHHVLRLRLVRDRRPAGAQGVRPRPGRRRAHRRHHRPHGARAGHDGAARRRQLVVPQVARPDRPPARRRGRDRAGAPASTCSRSAPVGASGRRADRRRPTRRGRRRACPGIGTTRPGWRASSPGGRRRRGTPLATSRSTPCGQADGKPARRAARPSRTIRVLPVDGVEVAGRRAHPGTPGSRSNGRAATGTLQRIRWALHRARSNAGSPHVARLGVDEHRPAGAGEDVLGRDVAVDDRPAAPTALVPHPPDGGGEVGVGAATAPKYGSTRMTAKTADASKVRARLGRRRCGGVRARPSRRPRSPARPASASPASSRVFHDGAVLVGRDERPARRRVEGHQSGPQSRRQVGGERQPRRLEAGPLPPEHPHRALDAQAREGALGHHGTVGPVDAATSPTTRRRRAGPSAGPGCRPRPGGATTRAARATAAGRQVGAPGQSGGGVGRGPKSRRRHRRRP